MDRELLTTREVAELLQVGTTSIKRWTDAGLLPCVKTPGGHRRFARSAVEAFRDRGVPEEEGDGDSAAGWLDRWVSLLVRHGSAADVARQLEVEHQAAGSWSDAADVLGRVLDEIGDRWARGDLSVVEEHLASERLARGLARTAEAFVAAPGAPVALLLTAEGDDHTLGLGLLEVVLRERGWATRWLGRVTPARFAIDHIALGGLDLVCVSASVQSRDGQLLADQADRLGAACERAGSELVLGGRGAWPARPRHGHRVRGFHELDELLAQIALRCS
jgi:MerR family transcriptional regulator, light-induced transcriptional regulator